MPTLCDPVPRWSAASRSPAEAQPLARKLGISEIVAQLLLNRDLVGHEACERFLRPALTHLGDPSHIHHMDRAAQRIVEAFRNRERVLVYGDYDVDGVTGTTLMLDFLSLGGLTPQHYIPDRLQEGYSFSDTFLDRLDDLDVDLIISVDNGISSHQKIAAIRSRNTDVIVTDHHEPTPTLPDALAVVNPKVQHEESPFRELCGAAVAFKTVWATADRLSPGRRVSPEFREFLVDGLSLVSLATICDAVPLRGENRVLTAYGLRALEHTERPGLRALKDVACPGRKINEEEVGFCLGPRINAAGRMGHANLAVELLRSADYDHALGVAKELNATNDRRKKTEQEILAQARTAAEEIGAESSAENGSSALPPVLVMAKEGWHPGVVGIVATRLAEALGRPTILIGLDGERGRGSGRSVRGFHLLELLQRCSEHLIQFGGHAFAAGLEIRQDQVEPFRQAAIQIATEMMGAESAETNLVDVDLEVELRELTLSLVNEIDLLAPFGRENPRPVFVARDLELAGEPQLMGGNGQHLSFLVRQRDTVLRAVGFRKASHYQELVERRRVSLLFSPTRNTFRGHTTLELRIHDLQFA